MPAFGKCKVCGKVVWGTLCRECYRDQHESELELGNGGEEVKELDEDAGDDR